LAHSGEPADGSALVALPGRRRGGGGDGLTGPIDLHELPAARQAALIRRGELSPVELVDHHLARISALDGRVGAFVTVTADAALAAAKAAADRVARPGPGGRAALPPLLGVPMAFKDLTRTRGVRTMLGSAAFADHVPDGDDHVVTALRTAGAISLGKTNTPELGSSCYTESDVAPPARTPWDLTRTAGGSSGGSAAAVAAGFVGFAEGSDGGGSVRGPASCCGVVGLKVSRGRISNGPLGGDLTGLGWHGPLARTVADAALALDAMAGYRPGDPHWAPPLPPGETFAEHARRDPGRLRVGRYIDNALGAPVHPDCRAAWESVSRLLASLGHEVVDVPVPPAAPMETFFVLWSALFAAVPVPPGREQLLTPLVRWLREQGRAAGAAGYLRALAEIQLASRAVVASTAPFDAVLTPTLAQPPAPVGSQRDDADPEGDFWRQARFTPYTSIYNGTGQPAVSLPAHRTDAGLSIGVQLVGRPGDEAGLLRLAGHLEAAGAWSGGYPVLT
jgi:amidase